MRPLEICKTFDIWRGSRHLLHNNLCKISKAVTLEQDYRISNCYVALTIFSLSDCVNQFKLESIIWLYSPFCAIMEGWALNADTSREDNQNVPIVSHFKVFYTSAKAVLSLPLSVRPSVCP